MSSHQKTLTIVLFLRRRYPFLVYFQSSSRLHHLYIIITSWLPHWRSAHISLLMKTSQTHPIRLSMWLIFHHLRFLLMVLIWMILLLYHYHDHWYHIHMILVSLNVNPCPCLILQKYLLQFLLKARLQGFIHNTFHLNSLSCCPKCLLLAPTQTLDIGQRWVVFKLLIFPIPSWKLHRIWAIQSNNSCEYIYWRTATWISFLHIHLINLGKYWGCFFYSMCLLSLSILWRRTPKNSLHVKIRTWIPQ